MYFSSTDIGCTFAVVYAECWPHVPHIFGPLILWSLYFSVFRICTTCSYSRIPSPLLHQHDIHVLIFPSYMYSRCTFWPRPFLYFWGGLCRVLATCAFHLWSLNPLALDSLYFLVFRLCMIYTNKRRSSPVAKFTYHFFHSNICRTEATGF